MKKLCVSLCFLLTLFGCANEQPLKSEHIINSDIDNFWVAYDSITATNDTVKQWEHLNQLYLSKASLGLKSMIQARNYTAKEYVQTINEYPQFWKAIRENTGKAKAMSTELEVGIEKLKTLYPELKLAKIYFVIGALRSNGTTLDSMVLIGSELAFANSSTPSVEFPEYLSHLSSFFESEPSENIVFLNLHEYVHTQQKTTIGENLLAQTLLEGVAEFVAEKALGSPSPNPQINFGRENDARIKAAFEKEMFSPHVYNWIWNSPNNPFGVRDLAYYVGYQICENYYTAAADKQAAISEMIELDYNDEQELVAFVEQSGYFKKPMDTYKTAFEESRPTVLNLGTLENNSENVAVNIQELIIHFSQPMDTNARNFQLGSLGEDYVLRIEAYQGFSEDQKSVRFKIAPLSPTTQYQIVVGSGFTSEAGVPLVPYLIDFKTTGE